jgi:hypothetical protein
MIDVLIQPLSHGFERIQKSLRQASRNDMRSFVSLTLFALGCGGPLGVPPSSEPDDTAQPEVERDHGVLVGVVTSASGEPLAGATVVSVPRGHEAQADDSGAYELPWLPAGTYDLQVAAEGYQAALFGPVELSAGQTTSLDAELEAQDASSLVSVTVLGPGGEPVEGALVSVSSGEQAVADADGVALFEGLAGDDLVLTAAHPDDALWARSIQGVDIAATGGLQWQAELSGRPAAAASYTGGATCLYCHADQAEAHGATAHARAHVEQPSEALLERFELGETLALGDARADLWLDGAQPMVTLTDADGASEAWAVASYLGDPERRTVPVVVIGAQRYPLPFAWHAPRDSRESYPDSDPRLVAFELERWFDEQGDFAFTGEGPAPSGSADAACLPCHSSGYTLSHRGDGGVDLAYAASGGLYAGVGCEACHGPSSGHTSSMDPDAITHPAKLDPQRADEACGQCHDRTQGLDSGLPHPHGEPARFTPGDELGAFAEEDGEQWPSGLARQTRMQLYEHRAAVHGQLGMRCVDCHGVHDSTEPGHRLLRLDAADNALCEACHLGAFDDSELVALEHMRHRLYQPEGTQEGARCTGCHMPRTASDGFWSAESGAGEVGSHSFVAALPDTTLAVFDAAGASELPLGEFPTHACADCHAWNAWYFDGLGLEFDAPTGDPTLASTHEAYQAGWEEVAP